MKTVLVILICMLLVAIEIAVLVAITSPKLLVRALGAVLPLARTRRLRARAFAPRGGERQEAH